MCNHTTISVVTQLVIQRSEIARSECAPPVRSKIVPRNHENRSKTRLKPYLELIDRLQIAGPIGLFYFLPFPTNIEF